MSYSNGPKIITDNLILHLDAATYPGYGKWLDMSGYQSDGMLLNGVSYTNDSFGAFQFDATYTQHIECLLKKPMTTQYTICIVTKRTFNGIAECIFSSNYGSLKNIGFTTSNAILAVAYDAMGSWPNYYTGTAGNTISAGVIYHISFVVDDTSLKLYINGNQSGATKILPAIGPITSTDLSTKLGQTGMSWSRQWFTGNIYSVSAYNYPLSDSDVKNNYLATKSRFLI
jgi:hypothetical protein